MSYISAFIQVSLDGYFASLNGDMSWAHKNPDDHEWNEFVGQNSSSPATLLFGRVTYDLMASFWPTPQATQMNATVASNMNQTKKLVVSNSLQHADWKNTTVVRGDVVSALRKQKAIDDIVALGSGSIVKLLVETGLLDTLQIIVCPIALGQGKSLFAGLKVPISLQLRKTRAFKNGSILLDYAAS